MPFVQLLFDFAREQLGLFGGSGGGRVAKRPRRGKPAKGRAAPIKRTRPGDIAVTSALGAPGAPDAPGWRMAKPPRGIDHEKPSQRRYDAVVVEMLSKDGLTVTRWRNSVPPVCATSGWT